MKARLVRFITTIVDINLEVLGTETFTHQGGDRMFHTPQHAEDVARRASLSSNESEHILPLASRTGRQR